MQEGSYVYFNGDFRRSNNLNLSVFNRAFRYNDALTENIHASGTEGQFVDLHLDRLLEHMERFHMQVPLFLSVSNIQKLITALLNKNRIFGGAHIRLTIFRNGMEPFIPADNSVSFLLESEALGHNRYVLNEKGLTVGLCEKYIRHRGEMSAFLRTHLNLYLLASIEATKMGVDQVILLNDSGRLTETADSNIFLVSGNSLFTPGTSQGCLDGVMRRVILNCAADGGFTINDQSSLTPSALSDADEIFVTNAIHGIRWIGAYRQKRYFNKTAKLLNTFLNERAFA